MATVTLPRWLLFSVILALGMSLAFIAGSLQRASGDNHDTPYYACLYAGALSQVGTTEPVNCGRGEVINWNAPGPVGVQGYVPVINDPFDVQPGDQGFDTILCPDGTAVFGGGVRRTAVEGAAANNPVSIESSGPSSATSWQVAVRNDGADVSTFEAAAICAPVLTE